MSYFLKKVSKEVPYKERRGIAAGCTVIGQEPDPDTVGAFDTKEDALGALRERKTEIHVFPASGRKMFSVTEFFVETEDGDIVAFSDSKIRVVAAEDPISKREIGVFDSYTAAEDFVADHEGDGEVEIVF